MYEAGIDTDLTSVPEVDIAVYRIGSLCDSVIRSPRDEEDTTDTCEKHCYCRRRETAYEGIPE